MSIKSNQISYKILSKLTLQERAYWIEWMNASISRRKSKKHISWLKGLVKKLEMR